MGGLLIAAAGLLLAFHVGAQDCTPAPSDIISWWPGDGNANDIVGTHNATLLGGTTVSTPGVVGNCFVFDGTNSIVSIPDAPDLHPAVFTIEAWMRPDLLDTPSENSYPGQQYIIFHQNAETYGFEGFDLAKDRRPPFIGTNDTWCFEITSTTGDNVFVENTTPIKTNTWYHIVGVHGSNFIQLYVNGVLANQTNEDFPVGYGNEPMYFATTGQSYYDHKFGGALDEVTFYNRVLSSNEIAAIYLAGRGGKCKMPTVLSVQMTNDVSEPPQPYPQLNIAGLAGQAYGIQTASALTGSSNDWVGVTNLTLPANSDTWIDPAPATDTQKYYRVMPGTISVP
jgi:hypothetical protein